MGVEERLAALEAKLEETELQLKRAQAVTEIQNVMARYTLYHSAGRQKESLDCFAMRTPDVGVEIAMWGQCWGPQGLYDNYVAGIGKNEGDRIGFYCEHPVSTPLIEVARDCKTAKAIFFTFGPETGKKDPSDPECEYDANFMYGKYQVDFILENGHWKMWHFQVMPDIMWQFTEPFTEQKPHDDFKPDFEGFEDRNHSFCEEYDVNKARKFWPQPPDPYESWVGSKKHCMTQPTKADKIIHKRDYNQFTFEEYLEDLERRDPWKA